MSQQNNEQAFDNGVKLLLACGEIDDRLIDEARRPYPIFFTVKRTTTLVATLLLVVMVGIAALFVAPSLMAGDAATDANNTGNRYLSLGDKSFNSASGSSITFVDKTDYKYSFYINLTEDIEALNMYIYGYPMEGGQPSFKSPVVATTSDAPPSGYTVIDMPRLLVDGVEATALPTAAGTYLVTVDLSKIQSNYMFDRIGISYFDNAVFSYYGN